MYSKKNQIKLSITKRSLNNLVPKNNLLNSSSTRNLTTNNFKLFQTEEDKNIDYSVNNDYFKENYDSKKKKNNFVSYYSKKKFKSIMLNNGKVKLSNYILQKEPFYSDLNSLDRIRNKANYTIKNPQKDKSKNKNYKNSENNTSKNTLNKEDIEEEMINFYSNNNNSNTIYTDFLNNTESNKNSNLNMNVNSLNNLNININKTNRTRGNIDLSRYQDHNFSNKKKKKGIDVLQQSSSNISKGVSFILDYSKDDDRDNIYNESRFNMCRSNYNFNINSSINRFSKSPFCTSSNYNESIIVKRNKNKNKTPNRKSNSISKQIEYRKKNFENMRDIEKKIKNYFLNNGISLKIRELYHQSAIMIQSTFRAYLSRNNLYKELNMFVGIRLIFNLLNKIISMKSTQYYAVFFNNIKKYSKKKPIQNKLVFIRNEDYQYHIKNNSTIAKKSNILKKRYIREKNFSNDLKIELASYFNIINKKNRTQNKNINIDGKYIKMNRNQNLILLNEKISNEKKPLEEEMKKSKIENQKLQKENDKYKSKENQLSESNSLHSKKISKTNIYKINENIENVSLELKEIKIKKQKEIDTLNVPILNLKKNININDKKYVKNGNDDKTNLLKLKKIYLKYLILKKDIIIKEYQRKMFFKYLNIVRNSKEKIHKMKFVLDLIDSKFKKDIYKQFFKILYKCMYMKENMNQKKLLYIPKTKIVKGKINVNKDSNNDVKNKRLKNIVKNKINKDKNLFNQIFMKFYYKGLLYNNMIESNIKLEQRKKLKSIINNNMKKNRNHFKIIFNKFYYNGIIASIKNNNSKNNNSNERDIQDKKNENVKKDENNE